LLVDPGDDLDVTDRFVKPIPRSLVVAAVE
jgi:hypothetical protein